MKWHHFALFIIALSLSVFWADSDVMEEEVEFLRGVQAQAKNGKIISYPTRKYIRKEFGGDDWVVEIDIPQDGRAPNPYCECDRSQSPFTKTAVIDEGIKNGKRRFSFTAGYRARLTSAYSFEEWARVWRVSYYAPLQPRGPQPVKPRG